ncbi:hypothetical protein CKA32_004973 [Geitlerinema sp. FC II]|nr:hypothetical protein CKA32_004973 [Geitlerinema sp. FC II]
MAVVGVASFPLAVFAEMEPSETVVSKLEKARRVAEEEEAAIASQKIPDSNRLDRLVDVSTPHTSEGENRAIAARLNTVDWEAFSVDRGVFSPQTLDVFFADRPNERELTPFPDIPNWRFDGHQFHIAHDDVSVPGQWSAARPDGHAPIGVMGDHTHGAGEFMFSYRFMDMHMEGNRDGTDSLSNDEVLEQFPVTPTQMGMQMHMLGAMYAPTDELTLMLMVPYVSMEMDHRTRSGVRFTTNSDGLGDISLSTLYKIWDSDRQRLHLNFGLSFPTGSIDERDNTPAADDAVLPYPMQIGSGTYDLLPGITYLGQSEQGSWGAQVRGRVRLGRNDEDYALGDRLEANSWLARKWTDWFSTSVRVTFRTWGNVRGEDSRLNPMLIPTADPDRRAGSRFDVGLGLNLYDRRGFRLGVELELPIYQSLDGPQLETDWTMTVGLQASF